MKHTVLRRCAPLVLLGTCLAATSPAPTQAAPVSEQMRAGNRVRAFYSWYVGQLNADKPSMSNPAMIASYSSKRLGRWFRSPAFRDYDADYFLQAQDFDHDWTRARIQNVRLQGRAASLTATLGAPKADKSGIGERKLHLNLVKENGVWKIDRVAGIDN